MISVCVPIYNRDMRETVQALARQAAALTVPAEVVCIDDRSDDRYRALNAGLERWCRYVPLDRNVGRARIRNLFLQYTQYGYLLFLDCDSIVPEGFLARYAALLEAGPEVVCGGREYRPQDNDRAHRLRYRYGVCCESKTAAERRRHPHRSFMTNNFVVRREVLQAVPFDERICRYGHEDTLFGYELMRHGIAVTHVDNPVGNGDVEPNAEFLGKTQEGVRSLAEIYRRRVGDGDFAAQVSLLRFYERVRGLHATWAVRMAWHMTRRLLERGFVSGRCADMTLLAFYKLGLFCTEMQR